MHIRLGRLLLYILLLQSFQYRAAKTGLTAEALLITDFAEYEAALDSGWAKSGQALAKNGPAVGPEVATKPQSQSYQPVAAVPSANRPPDFGRKIGDSAESLAILAELNALPLSSEIPDEELARLNAVRRYELTVTADQKLRIGGRNARKSRILNHLGDALASPRTRIEAPHHLADWATGRLCAFPAVGVAKQAL